MFKENNAKKFFGNFLVFIKAKTFLILVIVILATFILASFIFWQNKKIAGNVNEIKDLKAKLDSLQSVQNGMDQKLIFIQSYLPRLESQFYRVNSENTETENQKKR